MSQNSIGNGACHVSDEVVAVLAGGRSGRVIAAALDRYEQAHASFEAADRLFESAEAWRPATIIACVEENAVTSMQARIEPIVRRFSTVPLVVVAAAFERRTIRAALAAGALGLVLSAQLEFALQPCLLAVRAGQICLPRSGWREIDPPVLSLREKQVLGLLVMGYMNSQIASQLFLAESTVKSHLSSAFSKLGVRSRHEAVARILDPETGLGVGILAVSSEPLETIEA